MLQKTRISLVACKEYLEQHFLNHQSGMDEKNYQKIWWIGIGLYKSWHQFKCTFEFFSSFDAASSNIEELSKVQNWR